MNSTPNPDHDSIEMPSISSSIRSGSNSIKVNWLFITNQLNLMMILSAGLFMSKEDFGDKYYSDLLPSYPGWIPLFPNAVPQAIVNRVVAEAKHLRPVVVELDISCIKGPAKIVQPFGATEDITLPEGISSTANMLLVAAPLPVSLIKKIYFISVEDKKSFTSRAQSQYSNVPEFWFDKSTEKKKFRDKSTCMLNSLSDWRTGLGSFGFAQAFGGMFTLLFHLANRSDSGSRYLQWLGGISSNFPDLDPLLEFLPKWINIDRESPLPNIHVSLFWTLVNDVVSAQDKDLSRDVVLEALKREIDRLDDISKNRYQDKLNQLCLDLEGLRGLSSDTLDDLFNRHTRPFSRALIIFFLINKCRELLEFDHKALTPSDLLAAAILFGARERWINFPVDLRQSKKFADYLAIQMAELIHRNWGTGLTFLSKNTFPLPLRALLNDAPDSGERKKRIDEAMLAIARRQKWDCIETTIRLPKGEYCLVVEQSSTRLVLDGDIKYINFHVKRELFWDLMSRLPLPLPEIVESLVRPMVE